MRARASSAGRPAPARAQNTSGPIVVEGKVISGRGCGKTRDTCFIAAHDALTGKEVWKFYNVPAPGEPGSETLGQGFQGHQSRVHLGTARHLRSGSQTALLGHRECHAEHAAAAPRRQSRRHVAHAPADLYSNSTVSLDPETGKLNWYYQHLPGDDWDMDYTHERTLVRENFNPDPKYVKWFNPDMKRGEEHDVAVMVGEGGGVFVLDRDNGQFLWATPFPYDDPLFLISNIDGKTGKMTIN